MNLRNLAINSTLALSGAALWSYGATRLAAGGEFDYRPNPLGLKMSPYGQVIALALQGGIDADWHGIETAAAAGHSCSACGQHHGTADTSCDTAATKTPSATGQGLIDRLEAAATERTNPRPATDGHKFYLRRQVEDRLRFAYELDPSNYANYNAYHLFLTEPSVGTRRVLTERVLMLARLTIDYSLREESDPRPALTAAAASGNILELMFLHQADHDLDEMKRQLAELDHALARHRDMAAKWLSTGEFQRLSPARQHEMLERFHFVTKVRDASAQTIQRLSSAPTEQASNSH
jgi:hypothetical protein